MLRILTFVRALGYISSHLFLASLHCWYESTGKLASQLHRIQQNPGNIREGNGGMTGVSFLQKKTANLDIATVLSFGFAQILNFYGIRRLPKNLHQSGSGEGEMRSLNQSGFWNGNFPHTNIFPLVAATGALLAWDLLSK